MKLGFAHLMLLALALAASAFGVLMIARGAFDRSYDSTIWNYLGLGVPLLLLAATFVVLTVRDARRAQRRRSRR